MLAGSRRPTCAAVDFVLPFRCYIITLGTTARNELVPKTREVWLAAGAVCARDPVCVVVRAFPRGGRPRRAGTSDRVGRYGPRHCRCAGRARGARRTAAFRSRYRSTNLRLRDLRRHLAGEQFPVCHTAAAGAAAGG